MRISALLVATLVLALSSPAVAVIEALLKIGNIISSDSDAIYMTRVEKVDAEKGQVVFSIQEELHAKPIVARLNVNLKAGKESDIPLLLKRIAPELPVLMFQTQLEGRVQVLAYTNGTWFQLTKMGENPWAFVGCEPYLRRTYKGTTAELRALIEGVRSGKQKAPLPNAKEPPGLGPEITPSEPKEPPK